MAKEMVVFVKCWLMRAALPTECVFTIETDAGDLKGAAPIQYCCDRNYNRMTEEAIAKGKVEGFVVGLQITGSGTDTRVYLPDGEIYEIDGNLITFPKEATRCTSPAAT